MMLGYGIYRSDTLTVYASVLAALKLKLFVLDPGSEEQQQDGLA